MATKKRLIEKLPTGSTSKDGIYWEKHPTGRDIIEKIDEIIEALNTLLKEHCTADAVEVVRCEDCKYRVLDTVNGEDWCNHTLGLCSEVYATDFCCHGERKDNG